MSAAQTLPHDVLLLMLNLSQLQDSERIVKLFLDAINSSELGVHLGWVEGDGEAGPISEEIATQGSSFGHITFDGNANALSPDVMPVLRDAVRVLALILENRQQARIVEQERQHFERTVEERSELILRTAIDGFWMTDATGNILEVNDACCLMMGYRRDELLSMHIHDVEVTETREEIAARIRLIRESGGHRFETRHRRKDDVSIDVEVSANYLDHDGGRFFTFFRDITERKRTEEALRRLVEATSSQFGSAFFGAMAVQLSKALDADYTLIGELQGTQGASVGTIAVAVDGELSDNFEYDLAGTPCESVLDGGVCSFASGVADRFPDDALLSQIGVEGYVGVPLFDSQGAALGIMAALFRKPLEQVEFTEAILQVFSSRSGSELERLRSDKSLVESEERMELALRGADLGTWDWNVQTGDVTFNERWAEMLGYALDEIEPHLSTWERLIHPDDMPGVEEELNAHLEGTTSLYESEHRVRHKSGEWVWVLDRGRLIERDADGKPLRACGTHLDVTERKKGEEALQSQMQMQALLLSELDHRVRNNLCSLLALIDLSRSSAQSIDDLASSMRSRAQALASVHSFLSRSQGRGCDIREMLKALVDAPSRPRVHIDGPQALIPPSQVQALGLVINEFTTNSVKYGAMSVEDAVVNITWTLQNSENGETNLTLLWSETGGPPIEAEPTPGTGANLIIGLARSELRGHAGLTFPREGVAHSLHVILAADATSQFGRAVQELRAPTPNVEPQQLPSCPETKPPENPENER